MVPESQKRDNGARSGFSLSKKISFSHCPNMWEAVVARSKWPTVPYNCPVKYRTLLADFAFCMMIAPLYLFSASVSLDFIALYNCCYYYCYHDSNANNDFDRDSVICVVIVCLLRWTAMCLQFPWLLRDVAEQVSEQDEWHHTTPLAATVQS